ncbi:hypothetical protein GOODEAATRI_021970 [Goodea atripinnis]|uniref:Myosin motor domain-containing protein n=1 Tax=Goodea atripinnis TaxID=208336 RepID=A0ABV0MVK7_9TELE
MEMVGFLPATRKQIFSLLSAILHLGNIRYKKKTYRDDSIDICNPEVLPIVSELLEDGKNSSCPGPVGHSVFTSLCGGRDAEIRPHTDTHMQRLISVHKGPPQRFTYCSDLRLDRVMLSPPSPCHKLQPLAVHA